MCRSALSLSHTHTRLLSLTPLPPILPSCRLINRGLYQLAMEICVYLKLPPVQGEVKVLRQWAMRKVGVAVATGNDCFDGILFLSPLSHSSLLPSFLLPTFLLLTSLPSPSLPSSFSLPSSLPSPSLPLKVMDMNLSEEDVGEAIISKLSSSPVVVSFAEIARVARANNRKRLAAQVPSQHSLGCALFRILFSCWGTKCTQRTKCRC